MLAVQETDDWGKAPVTQAVAPRPAAGTGGPKLLDCLRVQDIDFSRKEILVRDGKGAKPCGRALKWSFLCRSA